jgi:predicted LPLAT superfamily acyltransferase
MTDAVLVGGVQVKERRTAIRIETAHAALETALNTVEVETLRKLAEAAWRSEQDIERLRGRAVRACQKTPALAERMELVLTTQCLEELREVGLEAVRTAGKDTLYAMAVHAAAQDGVDVNTRVEAAAGEEPKERWLTVAANKGLVETLRALVEAGAAVDHASNDGCTALWVAAHHGHVEAMQALLAAGAEVNHVDNKGFTALDVAASSGHVEAINALLAAGAAINHVNNEGYTALYVAADRGHLEAMLALLAAGAEVDLADHDGPAALDVADLCGHVEAIRALLSAGADVPGRTRP